MDFIIDFLESRYKKHLEDRLKWGYLNNGIGSLLKSKGAKDLKMYTDMLDKLLKPPSELDLRSDEEITEEVLDKFKKLAEE